MKLSELIKQSHDLAVEKGWWEKPDVDEKLLMIHSEISEAVECYRNGEMVLTYDKCPTSSVCFLEGPTCQHTYYTQDVFPAVQHTKTTHRKPLGFPTEIADVAIRCADLLGYLDDGLRDDELPIMSFPVLSVPKGLLGLHRQLDLTGALANSLEICIDRCCAIAEFVGFDLNEAIRIKHEFNRTRSHRHGGKRI